MLELALSLALVALLLAVLLPALASARLIDYLDQCTANQSRIGQAWEMYLDDHEGAFPYVPTQPAWHWGGVRFSPGDEEPYLDPGRPLSAYLPYGGVGEDKRNIFHCPADRGIRGETAAVGTAGRSAFRAYGTSYRANHRLMDAHLAGIEGAHRGLRRAEIVTAPSRLMVMGTPIWYEIQESTDRDAAWHGDPDKGNLLFMDGSVRYKAIQPKNRVGPIVYRPKLRSLAEPAENGD